MDYAPLIMALAFVGYALLARRSDRSPVSGPMVFAGVGVLIGPEFLDVVTLEGLAGEVDFVNLVLTTTLVVVLFSDACAINSADWHDDIIPARLLGIGLPLTVVAGTMAALVVYDVLSFWEAAVLGTMLAPTDAALGKAVIGNPRVPERIRQALNIESGLNDGVALPLFVVFVEAAEVAEQSLPWDELVTELLAEVGVAIGVGVAVGWAGTAAVRWAAQHRTAGMDWLQLAVVGLAPLAYAAAVPLGGSGFIAAWVAGLTFGRLAARVVRAGEMHREGDVATGPRSQEEVNEVGRELHHFGEVVGAALTMGSFFLFGLYLAPVLTDLDWRIVVSAVLSLTVVRMVPVALSLLGSGLAGGSYLYLGWFGPRGLATIILTIEVVEGTSLDGAEVIADVALFTVALSVVAHGATAWWGSNRYADYVEAHPDAAQMPEAMEPPGVRTTARMRAAAPMVNRGR